MAGRKKAMSGPVQAGARTGYQVFEYQEIPRDQITAAPYNPRQISEYARRLLKKKLEEVGCVTPLVWNRQTGNLVSGHQRLSIMDDLEGGTQYLVGVAVIDVDDRRERELNIFLNNAATQGNYDKDAFLKMVKDGLDLGAAGLTRIDLEFEFGDLPEIDGLFAKETAAAAPVVEEIEALVEKRKAKSKAFREERKQKIAEKEASPGEDANYYVQVVFESTEQKHSWMRRHDNDETARVVMAGQIFGDLTQKKPAADESTAGQMAG